jgi:hypothetical protein
MPKHGSKWLRNQFLELTPQEQEEYLNISAKFARWAYAELPLTERARRAALVVIGCDRSAPWTTRFLLAELDRTWQERIGSFVISRLGRKLRWDDAIVARLLGLFDNSDAHESVRAISLHVLGHCLMFCPAREREWFMDRMRSMCDQAIWDDSSPDMRMCACIGAYYLRGYEERLSELSRDVCRQCLGVQDKCDAWAFGLRDKM